MKKKIQISIGVLLLIVYGIISINRCNDKIKTMNDYSITEGWITKYSIVSDMDHRYLTYSYMVQGSLYSRTITPSVYFDSCRWDIDICKEKRFRVLYLNTNYNKSLIDLTNDIRNNRNAEISELDKFQ